MENGSCNLELKNGDCTNFSNGVDHSTSNISLVFSVKDKGKEAEFISALKPFQELAINITHLESRPSKTRPGSKYEFYVDCACTDEQIEKLAEKLDIISTSATVPNNWMDQVPWFPKSIEDLYCHANDIITYDALDADHPGFTDQAYKARRDELADIAKSCKYGDPIPRIEYSEEEIKTWSTIYCETTKLHPTHACREYNDIFPLLMKHCGYREDNIPQLEDVNSFLKKCTGFRVRPVAGLFSSRDFLAGFAFRMFHCTQYVRHNSRPMYTPEPDVCHELLGHVPLFCDESFAQFSQEIGLASLGAPDEYVKQLATLYWFTAEVGLCEQQGKTKAYGAALLSSFGELKHSLSDEVEVRPLDAAQTAVQEYDPTDMQPLYFMATSFEDAKKKVMEFAKNIPRPFSLRYNPYTERVEIINDKDSVQKLVNDIKYSVELLQGAIGKIN